MRKHILSVVTALGISSGLICYAPQDASAAFSISDFEYSSDCFYDPEIYTESIDYSLYNRFIKYDLCITDYEDLTDEEKELCQFIFEHERSANQTIRCERARRILAGDDVGERLTYDDIQGKGCIVDPDVTTIKGIYNNYAEGVPDIMHLDSYMMDTNEYWLDDFGEKRILWNPHNTSGFGYIEYLDVLNDDNSSYNTYQLDNKKWLKYETVKYDNEYEKDSEKSSGDWKYCILRDGTAAITGHTLSQKYPCTPLSDTVDIPSEIDGYEVSVLGCSFAATGVSKVVLPETLKIISDFAFVECEYLTEIEINCPDAEIGNMAFSNTGLTKAVINSKYIGENAFKDCDKLEKVILNGVEKIEPNAFIGCTALSEVEISSSLKTIGQGAFSGTSIDSVNVPPTVEILGSLPERHGNLFENPANDPLTDEPECVFDPDCVINGWYGTEAHSYAVLNNLKFNPMDELLYGDANNDGEIGISDAVALQKYLLRNETVGYEADLNKDGRIDSFDMIAMRKMLVEN